MGCGKKYFDGSGIQLILGSGVQDSFKIESKIGKKAYNYCYNYYDVIMIYNLLLL